MKFLITPLADFFYLTIQGIQATNNIFTSGFQLSYFIGQNIVSLLVNVLEKMCLGLQIVYYAAYVLYEDYCFFIADLVTKIKWIVNAVQYIFKYLCAFCEQVMIGLKSSYDSVYYSVYSNFEFVVTLLGKGASSIYNALEILKQSLIFMGNGIWFLISFLPLTIMYLTTLFLCFISHSFLELYLALCNILQAISSIFESTIIFFSDVPAQSACGLILGSISTYFLVKNYSVIVQLIARILLLLLGSGQILRRMWNCLQYFFSRIFSPQRNMTILSRNEQLQQTPQMQSNVNGHTNRSEYNECRENSHFNYGSSRYSELGKLCIVCQDLEVSAIIFPCRHVCLCSVCCDIIEERYGRCPICRQRVERTMTVFI